MNKNTGANSRAIHSKLKNHPLKNLSEAKVLLEFFELGQYRSIEVHGFLHQLSQEKTLLLSIKTLA